MQEDFCRHMVLNLVILANFNAGKSLAFDNETYINLQRA